MPMNPRYTKYANFLLTGGALDLTSADIVAVLVRSVDYAVDIDGDEFLDDVPSGAIVATSGLLTGVTTIPTGGIDADDLDFGTPAAGDPADVILIVNQAGTPSTSRLLFYMDTFPAGMPVEPDGVSPILVVLNAAGLVSI